VLPRGTRRMRGRLAPIRVTRPAVWIHRLPTRLRRPVVAGCDKVSATRARPVGAATAVKQVPSLVKSIPAARCLAGDELVAVAPVRDQAATTANRCRRRFKHPSGPRVLPDRSPQQPEAKPHASSGWGDRGAAGVALVDPRVSAEEAADAPTHQSGWVPQLGWYRSDGIRPERTGRPRGGDAAAVELAISAVHERRSGR